MLKANRVMAVKKIFWLGAVVLATGFFASSVFAAPENTPPRQNTKARLSVSVDPTLSVTIPDRFDFQIRSDSILHYAEFNFTVSTNSVTGFNAKASVTNTDFVKSDDSNVVVSTIDYPAPNNTEDFPLNRWGLSFPAQDPDTFLPATTDMLVDFVDSAAQNYVASAVIGARIDNQTAPGSYNCTIVFQVTTNPLPSTIRSIEYLQQMSAEVAASMQEGVSYQLEDSRNQKTYWVVKHNGQIAMQQNLDLEFTNDIQEGLPNYTVLRPETSDVTEERTMTLIEPWGNSDADIYYHAGGDVYYPEGYKTPIDTEDLSPYADELKFSAGSYYSWNSATAGTGAAVSAAETAAPESICPLGWRLPLASELDLMTADRPLVRSGHYDSTTGNVIGTYDGANPDSGSLYLWTSSTGSTANTVKYMAITSSGASIAEGSRTDGFSVRCVADPPNEFALTYDANGGSGVPDSYHRLSWDENIDLAIDFGTTPTWAGKTFIGWARTADASMPEFTAEGDQIVLVPGQAATVYAVWRTPCNPSATDIANAVCMQDINSTVASTMVSGTSYQVIDYRDNKTYFITKIGSKVWMTQNLDFDLRIAGTLTPDTSDVTENRTLTVDNSGAIRYRDGGDVYYAGGTTSTPTTGLTDNDLAWHYHAGSLYSWDAATAGVGATEGFNTESICPKGWTLPKFADYETLVTSEHVVIGTTNSTELAEASDDMLTFKADLDTSVLYAAPQYITLSGFGTESSNVTLPGSTVRFWTANEANEGHAHALTIYDLDSEEFIQHLDNENKNSRYTVRCVLK